MAFVNAIGVWKIIIYLLIINLIAFLAMGIDKRKAKKGAWRIPEQTLMSLVFLGRRHRGNCWNVCF